MTYIHMPYWVDCAKIAKNTHRLAAKREENNYLFTNVFDIDISTEFIHNYFWLFRFLIWPCVSIIRVWLQKRGYPNTVE